MEGTQNHMYAKTPPTPRSNEWFVHFESRGRAALSNWMTRSFKAGRQGGCVGIIIGVTISIIYISWIWIYKHYHQYNFQTVGTCMKHLSCGCCITKRFTEQRKDEIESCQKRRQSDWPLLERRALAEMPLVPIPIGWWMPVPSTTPASPGCFRSSVRVLQGEIEFCFSLWFCFGLQSKG